MLDSRDVSKFNKFYGDMPTGFAVIEVDRDAAGRPCSPVFRYINRALAVICGAAEAEILNKPLGSFSAEAEKQWLEHCGGTAFSEEKSVCALKSVNTGKHLHIECWHMSDGMCGCLVSDVSEEVGIREKLAMEHESFKAAIECSGLHHWEYDILEDTAIQERKSVSDLRIPKIMHNYPQSFLDTNMILPRYWDRYLEIHKKIKEGAPEASTEYEIWPPYEKSPIWERLIYKTIFGANGRPVRAIGTAIDITYEKNLEAAYNDFLEYQKIMTSSDVDAFKLNITKDTITALKDTMALMDDRQHKMSMTDFFVKSAAHIKDDSERKKYFDVYTRETMLDQFAHGKRVLSLECRYDAGGSEALCLKLSVQMAMHPVTKDIIGFTYSEDVTEERLNSAAIESLLTRYYDMVLRLNVRTGSFVIFLNIKDTELLPFPNGKDFDAENRRFANACVEDEAERERMISELSVAAVAERLDSEGAFVYRYTAVVKGARKNKELRISYFNKDAGLVCMARRDITPIK